MKHTNILVIVLCLLVSCNRNTIKIDETCGRDPDLVGQTVRFSLMSKSMTSTFNIYIKYEDDGTKRESVTTQGINENLLQFFIKYCADKNIVLKDPVMAFVIYTNSIASESTVNDDQIKGITVYTVKGNRIMHHLYLRDGNNNFYEEENVRVRVPWITANHISFYTKNYVFPDNQTHSTIDIVGNLFSKVWKNLDLYWTSMKYEVNPRPNPKVRSDTSKQGVVGTGCGSEPGCEVGTWDMICIRSWDNGFHCALSDGPLSPCPATELSYADEPLYTAAYNRNLMYDFKDDFLYNSAKGRKYIDYYYYLGKEWSGKFTFRLTVETAKVLKDFNPIMQAFLDSKNRTNIVPFTPQMSESLINLIDMYSSITTSRKGRAILEDIKQDINAFTNRKMSAILKTVN